ncbi:group I truncated hemoglobin [Micromonospora chalcea]|uniref:group I truncated hemoglobin n=1 Tax=Micromonospora chalcea TaxID=1874 RepID=UPI003D757F92
MDEPLLILGVTLLALGAISLLWWWLTPADDDPAPTPTLTERPPAGAPQPSMYARLGHGAIVAAIDQFYHRVLGDPELRPYFDRLSPDGLARLHRHQALLIGQLLGGPVHFDLAQLGHAHRHLGISHDAYWRAVMHLGAVLTGLRVPRDIVLHLMAALYDAESSIVSEPVAAR